MAGPNGDSEHEQSHDDAQLPRSVGQSGQPSEEPIAEAEAAAAEASTREQPLGRPGRPLDRRSTFFIGMTGAAGVAVTYGGVELVLAARQILLLVGLAFFVAMGLEPVVSWLVDRRLPRWAAVLGVVLIASGILAGFLAVAVPSVITQTTQVGRQLPLYLHNLRDPHSLLGRINAQFGIEQRLQRLFSEQSTVFLQGLVGAGQILVGLISGSIVVIALAVYFLATMPQIRQALYRLAPAQRRPRAVLLGDEIFAKVGGYVLGNLITSVIAGVVTFAWLVLVGVPFALLSAMLVALLDLVPVVGTIVAGAIVSLVALSVSAPVALATVGFFVVYRLFEDYLLWPKVMGSTVRIPAVVTVVATLLGGALLGVIGAAVAIPLAAVVRLLMHEVVYPYLDRS